MIKRAGGGDEDDEAELERLRAYRRAQYERSTSRAEPFAHGLALFTPEHPTKWDLNLLLVGDAAGVAPDELIAEAERLQAPAGLRHRKVTMLHGGDELVDGFTAAGWTAEEVVVMALRGADVRGAADAVVREVGFEAVRGLMEAWYLETMSAAEARDLADSDADTARALGARSSSPSARASRPPAAICWAPAASGRSRGSTRRPPTAATASPARRPHGDRGGPRARRRPRDDHRRGRRLAAEALRAAGLPDRRPVPQVHPQANVTSPKATCRQARGSLTGDVRRPPA